MIVDEDIDNAYDENDPIANALLEEGINRFGVASLIVGILSILIGLPCICFIGGFAGAGQFVLGVIALILGITGVKKKKNKKAAAIAGIILGGISVLTGGIMALTAFGSALYLISYDGLDDFGQFYLNIFDFLDYLLF